MAACALLSAPALAGTPEFKGDDTIVTDAGNAMLQWRSDGPVRLEISSGPEFTGNREVYSGPAHSYFISGLSDGDYSLQLQSEDGSASEPLTLSVRHQSLERALWLVAMGALVTLMVIATILRGARDE